MRGSLLPTQNQINTDTEIAMPMSRNNCPTGKFSVNTGMNMMTVEARNPELVPNLTSTMIGRIFCINATLTKPKNISKETIDASTTMPTAKANPQGDHVNGQAQPSNRNESSNH